ncbi:hypothetical protein [Virgibacillus sp. CBA3643]|uniref:hypothetical protein n=1 Tax=Virgibacillus sp. CBA3643 TaxID=2942278 RepID=UPI0035A3944A
MSIEDLRLILDEKLAAEHSKLNGQLESLLNDLDSGYEQQRVAELYADHLLEMAQVIMRNRDYLLSRKNEGVH